MLAASVASVPRPVVSLVLALLPSDACLLAVPRHGGPRQRRRAHPAVVVVLVLVAVCRWLLRSS